MLETITSPKGLKTLNYQELQVLAEEIRNNIIETVSENGGHLASNLGLVETVLAIHRVFDTPKDSVIFDVGHQCYAHKLITGRYRDFATLRQDGGLSGFTSPEESEYDLFTEGHSGTSVSQALGVSEANSHLGRERYVIAIVGDGSFTNGMIYEALNNCKMSGGRLIIILNDNEMSISKNVGGLSHYLNGIRTSKRYFMTKHRIKRHLSRIPLVGNALNSLVRETRDLAKRLLIADNYFECLGIDYIGPVDGNDIEKTETVLAEAATKDVVTLVHIVTKKGKGYPPAEAHPEKYHSVSSFDTATGRTPPKKTTFSSVFGDTMCNITEKDPTVCAVTAAMGSGTGLDGYFDRFPRNSYDVGIAEEHAVTFSAGLSKGGLKPVAVMYSTFSQRVWDQLFHDVALQGIPFTLCLDRAGLVEGDGITHQGIYDVSAFSGIPGVNIFSPETFFELEELLEKCVDSQRFDIIRYPKGEEEHYDRSAAVSMDDYTEEYVGNEDSDDILTAVTYGRITHAVKEAATSVAERSGVKVRILKLVKIFPLDRKLIESAAENSIGIVTVEEGIGTGGIGEKIASAVARSKFPVKVAIHAVESPVRCGDLNNLFKRVGLTPKAIADTMWEMIKSEKMERENV